MGLTLLTARAAPATAAGGFGFAPEPLREPLIRGEEVNSCHVSPAGLCSSRSWCFAGGSAPLQDGNSGSLQKKPRVLQGHRQGSAAGSEQGWPWLLQGHRPCMASSPREEVLVSLWRLVRHAGGCPSSPVASPELQRGRGAALKAGTKQQKESGFLFSPVTHLSLISLGVSLQILQILWQMLSSPRLSSPRRLPSSELPAARAEERENTNPANSPTNNPRPTSITSGNVEALGAFTGVPSLCAAAGNDRFCGS